ncbi:MAG: hypothetical protein R2800_06670 [Flavipsychrobacter sp.]
MVKNEELFVLIKSLTRSEKRYFKLEATKQKGSANYLLLFDAIEKQELYDEKAIKKLFADKAFIKQLHVTKNYLREQILSSLRSFHSRLSKDAELKELLRNTEILFHKELYQLCRVELVKAERLAEKYELITGATEIIGWKRKLRQALQPHDFPTFITLAKEQEKKIALLQESNAYWQNIVVNTWQMIGSQYPRGKYKILPLPKDPNTLENKVLASNISYIKEVVGRRQDKAQKQLYSLIALLEEYPHRLKEDPSVYVSTINNLASYLVFQKKDKEVLVLLNKAKNVYSTLELKTENKSLLKQILRTYNLELELYRDNIGKSDYTIDFIVSTEKFIEANRNKVPKDYLLSLWFQLAHIRFLNHDFDNALKWLNSILNAKFGSTRQDLQVQARMLNLIVHFEQKNFFVLRYFVSSTKRFLKKVKFIEPFENELFKFFAKLSNAPEYEYEKLFKDIYVVLFPEKKDSMVPNETLDYIDYKKWMEGYIKKKKRI